MGGKGDLEAAIMIASSSPPTNSWVSLQALSDLNSAKDMDALRELGGIDGLCQNLQTEAQTGLEPSAAVIEARQAHFGENRVPAPEPESFFALMWGNLQDPIIILLIFAAAVSTGLGAGIPEQRAHGEWIEGVAIWVAVFLVSGVGAANDWQKDKQFRKLNEQKDTIDIKAIRGGTQTLVRNHDLVVGDIVLLDAGDKLVADCLVVAAQGLVVDEASLTGESDPVKKNREMDPWLRSGTQIAEGSGKGVIVAVGISSEWGKTMELMAEAGDDQTPLQIKLEGVATGIGKVGFGVAVCCFIAMLVKWCVENDGFPLSKVNDNGPIQFFLYAITIIVVAVPEGLPLAVTISLAYSMKKMLVDQNFVRHLAACETMGGATAICSDKTGTLTENRMTVVEGWFAGRKHDSAPAVAELRSDVLADLSANMAMNSKAFLVDTGTSRVGFVGSSTECALLLLLRTWGIEYNDVRKERDADMIKLHGFTSARKMSSVLLKHGSKYRLYNKGAAEWVLRKCNRVYSPSGDVVPMAPEALESLMNTVEDMAKRGLRCICLAYTDFEVNQPGRSDDFFDDPANLDQNLVALAIVGIKDPVRAEVPDAVATCQKAGITVRMVTGDNIYTAKHIARECGILASDEHTALEGPEFRKMHDERIEELQELLPRLRVLARSSPEDKLTLVRLLKRNGEVVAVTGDGTNDAPALKESDVGLAMGIAGTEVAKEAADIIILDDNFNSIVKSVLWGRSTFNNIRKFLQFQLTVNCSALIICFIGAVAGGIEPLNVLQLLWVNLIMDTMGALALATELPTLDLLDQKPHGHEEPLINGKMWKHILIQGIFQVSVMLFCLYGLPSFGGRYTAPSRDDYYADNCVSKTADKLGIPVGNGSYNAGVPDATWYCNVMQHCGFPLHSDQANTLQCPLYRPPDAVPSDETNALCFNTAATLGQDCAVHASFKTAKDHMSDEYDDDQETYQERYLSVLFNAFIWCQIFNEVNARRINDQYNMWEGLHRSPIFIGVLLITAGLQAIIINFMGIFFKVVPLDWDEWLACIAAGFGSTIISWITRFVSRNVNFDVLKLRSMRGRTASGRPKGRTASGLARVSASMDKYAASNHGSDDRSHRSGAGGGASRADEATVISMTSVRAHSGGRQRSGRPGSTNGSAV